MEMFHGDEFEPTVEARFEVCELYLLWYQIEGGVMRRGVSVFAKNA